MAEISVRAQFDISRVSSASSYYRVLHDFEMGELWRFNTPEVCIPPLNGERTPFGKDWQLLSWELMKHANPYADPLKWRSVYMAHRAFNNSTGFPQRDGDEPHADYVNGIDLSCSDPAWDKTHGMAGATWRGIEEPPYLIVDIMDGFGPAPTLDYVLARPWLYFHALNVTADGITKFAQNDGHPCLVPLVGSGVAKILLSKVQKVAGIADPYCYGYKPSPY